VTESLLQTFGLFGGAAIIGFIAGMFPIISVELFLIGVSTLTHPSPGATVLLVLLAAVGHQIAKSICYFAGEGMLALPKGKMKLRVERARARIDRWNKRPKLILFLSTTVGFPPLYLLAFIAGPLMKMRFWQFTAFCFFGRIGRFAFMMIVPRLIQGG
jgi:membrane protein YqaA with SNARE-associated domain